MTLNDLIPFVVFAVFWGMALLLCPITFYKSQLSTNALNTPIFIIMRRGVDYPAAVWAQEYFEARFRLVRFWYGLYGLVSGWLGLRAAERRIELMGHAVELAAIRIVYEMKGDEYFDYFWKEVRTMRRGYEAFEKMSENEIATALNVREKRAEAFVRRNLKKIRKHQ